jgi:opacity protein-like surface antigen
MIMRPSILALATAAMVASPAAARDGAPYVGIEGGILFPQTTRYSVDSLRVQSVPTGGGLLGQTVTTTNVNYGSGFVSDYKRGVDLDATVGYDLGFFRIEGEVGYKRTRVKNFTASSTLLAAINTAPISGVTSSRFGFPDQTRVTSVMLNGLVDYDIAPGVRVYGGGGAGRARVKSFGQRDNGWAYQLIAGASTAISANVDLGLKYRYFQTGRLHYANGAVFSDPVTGATSTSTYRETGKFRSHSLLASLIFNFGGVETAPPPPPPPMVEAPAPPPPPATQTCADGSVIDATAACPVAPPPPPPPPPSKGERG